MTQGSFAGERNADTQPGRVPAEIIQIEFSEKVSYYSGE